MIERVDGPEIVMLVSADITEEAVSGGVLAKVPDIGRLAPVCQILHRVVWGEKRRVAHDFEAGTIYYQVHFPDYQVHSKKPLTTKCMLPYVALNIIYQYEHSTSTN
jgi:hypothetical protein